MDSLLGLIVREVLSYALLALPVAVGLCGCCDGDSRVRQTFSSDDDRHPILWVLVSIVGVGYYFSLDYAILFGCALVMMAPRSARRPAS